MRRPRFIWCGGREFRGEVASFYARYRRGYPGAFTSMLARALRLGPDAVVADIGCGTGQLTIPLAGQARAVAGVDPEPDMLALAAHTAAAQKVTNVTWVLGSDEALPALATLAGGPVLDAVTVANAIHLMPEQRLLHRGDDRAAPRRRHRHHRQRDPAVAAAQRLVTGGAPGPGGVAGDQAGVLLWHRPAVTAAIPRRDVARGPHRRARGILRVHRPPGYR